MKKLRLEKHLNSNALFSNYAVVTLPFMVFYKNLILNSTVNTYLETTANYNKNVVFWILQ